MYFEHPLGGLCARCAETNFPAGINQGQQATPPCRQCIASVFLGLTNTCCNRNDLGYGWPGGGLGFVAQLIPGPGWLQNLANEGWRRVKSGDLEKPFLENKKRKNKEMGGKTSM